MASAVVCKFVTVVCFFILYVPSYVYSNRVFEKMYEDIQSNLVCFKRLNGTHEIGCTSSFWGNVGVIHYVEDKANLTWFIEKGPHPPYVIALVPGLFTVEVLKTASESGKLSGIVVLGVSRYPPPPSFSGDQTCPNRESSLYLNSSLSEYCEQTPWNPHGSFLLHMNWNFPIFLVDDDESVDKIIMCYEEFNKPNEYGESRDWPLCAIELYSNMYATTSSEVCLRRSEDITSLTNLCEPLQDINIWGSIHPFNTSYFIPDESLIIVSAAGDAASLFDNISPGANAAISGLVTLLVTAEALFRYKEDLVDNEKNVLFTVFEGEAWDYIGSSRMVYDMVNDKFPNKNIEGQEDQMHQLNLSHIKSIIDLKQTGFIHKENGVKNLFLHIDPLSNKDEGTKMKTENLAKVLIEESKNWDVELMAPSDQIPIPPSSFQTFLKKQNISGVVLADHEYEYLNQYYMSIYDNDTNLNYISSSNGPDDNDVLHKDIAQVASILASSLYNIVTGNKETIEADSNITNELLYCFLRNMNCTYFQESSSARLKTVLHPSPAKTFVSVERAKNPLPILIQRVLSRFMGKEVEFNETSCKSNETQLMNLVYFPYLNNGTCIETSVHHSSALSPAFTIKDYDWQSNEYSTWTESIWSKSEARIFLRPSPSEEIGLLIGGVISILLSVSVVYFLNSRASIIFDSEMTPTPC